MRKKYCPLCGNPTDPKIHIKDFGKASKEIAEIQKAMLKRILKESYFYSPNIGRMSLGSLIEDIEKVEKEVNKFKK